MAFFSLSVNVSVWISLKSHFFFQSWSKLFRKIHINNHVSGKYMNSFPNFNQISISIKDIAFLCFTNFHCNFVSNPTYITQSVWMLYYIWFIDLYFILFSSICIRHTLKLDFNILFWWYFEICTFNCIWFSRIVFFSLSEFGWQVEAICNNNWLLNKCSNLELPRQLNESN